jgi:hypothetical protein
VTRFVVTPLDSLGIKKIVDNKAFALIGWLSFDERSFSSITALPGDACKMCTLFSFAESGSRNRDYRRKATGLATKKRLNFVDVKRHEQVTGFFRLRSEIISLVEQFNKVVIDVSAFAPAQLYNVGSFAKPSDKFLYVTSEN